MQVAELTAEFGIAGILDFVEMEHGLVKAVISLDGVAGELYLQGAHLTAGRAAGPLPLNVFQVAVPEGTTPPFPE